jgi:hypothetical protein
MSYDRKRSHGELKSPMLLSTPLDDADPLDGRALASRLKVWSRLMREQAEELHDAISVREFGEALGPRKGPDAP